MKANLKRLKAALALGGRKLGSDSVAPKLGQFPLFAIYFDFLPLDLNDFWDLANFSPLNFPDFLAYSTPLPLNLSISPLLSFFLKAGLLFSILLKADLLPLFLLWAGLLGDPVVFNIKVNRAAIWLKS